ncbi:MAG: ABC transporter permease subunit [Pseudomonadota bacterium]|nr:ABC transporter permease subunit [Pseudomonadota bacterium]
MLDLKGYGWMLWDGVQITLAVAVCAMALALVLGLVGAWGKLSQSKAAHGGAHAYTTVIRGVPELILILIVYYGAPTLIQDSLENFGIDIIININPFIAGFITLGFIYGAFATEVFRGAYLAVPKGQIEAAKAIGMNRMLLAWRILLPQMWRFALPGLGNVWMVLIKATALISVIQLPELLRNSDIAARAVRMPFTFYFAASLIYIAIAIASMWAQHRAEAWAARGVRQA